MTLNNYLKQEYPISINKWAIVSITSVFIFIFLYIFKPFGLNQISSSVYLNICIGYGSVSLLILFINFIILPQIFPRIFLEETWTILKRFVWLSWVVFSIGIGNYFYSILAKIIIWDGITGLFRFEGFTLAVALIPLIIYTIITQNILLKRHIKSSEKAAKLVSKLDVNNTKNDLITLGNDKNSLQMSVSKILFIESEGNYVKVCYLKGETISTTVVRSTLKNIEFTLQNFPNLFRCHRAYIMNIHHIQKITGNAQGYKIHLKNVDFQIPVSRTYIDLFQELLQHK